MTRKTIRLFISIGLAGLMVSLTIAGLKSAAGPLTRVTFGTSDRDSNSASISSDGTKIAFQSAFDFLGQGNIDSILQTEIWLYDTATMTFTRITTGTSDRFSYTPSINSDGTKIAFSSDVDFLGQGNIDPGQTELWLYDTATMTFTRITTGTSDRNSSGGPSINSDGTKIAFVSNADLLAACRRTQRKPKIIRQNVIFVAQSRAICRLKLQKPKIIRVNFSLRQAARPWEYCSGIPNLAV